MQVLSPTISKRATRWHAGMIARRYSGLSTVDRPRVPRILREYIRVDFFIAFGLSLCFMSIASWLNGRHRSGVCRWNLFHWLQRIGVMVWWWTAEVRSRWRRISLRIVRVVIDASVLVIRIASPVTAAAITPITIISLTVVV